MTDPTLAPRRPWFAALLSFVFPGTGALYAGSFPWAVVSASLVWLMPFLGAFILLLIPPARWVVIVYGLTAFSALAGAAGIAFLIARRSPIPFTRTPVNSWTWYLGFSLGVASVSTFGTGAVLSHRFIKAYRIPSASMEPTLRIDDFLMVDRRPSARIPEIGGLRTFLAPEEPGLELLKRVVAVGGDTLEMRDGLLIRNGIAQTDDPFLVRGPADSVGLGYAAQVAAWSAPLLLAPDGGTSRPDPVNWGPLVLRPGTFFALGDHRAASWDSRFTGPVPAANITGSPRIIYWSRSSVDRIGLGPR